MGITGIVTTWVFLHLRCLRSAPVDLPLVIARIDFIPVIHDDPHVEMETVFDGPAVR